MTKQDWCKERGILPQHYVSLEMTLEGLSDIELAAQYNAVMAGFNPAKLKGFESIKHLFCDVNGSLRMRPEEIEIFGQVVASRLSFRRGIE